MIINTLRKKNFIKKILNFIYYLRYLILIFIFSIILIYTTPKLFKHVNKINEINYILKNQHGFNIKNTNKIKYKVFPQPNLELKNSLVSIGDQFFNLKIKRLKIYTNLKGLYVTDKIYFKKINFLGNFLGYDISGSYVPQKNKNLLNFKFKNLGIESKVVLNNVNKLSKPSGTMKFKILDDNLLINFNFDKNLQFKESIYKNKNIYTNFKGQLNFEPFFYFKIFAVIKKINLENLKLKKLYHLIDDELSNKKLNGELVISYFTKEKTLKTKKKTNKINMIFSNGDIISKNSIFQLANLNIKTNFYLKKYKLHKDLDYELLVESENIKKFYEIIKLKKDTNLKKMKLSIKGRINLDAQKYYFDKIMFNEKIINEKKLKKLKNYLEKNTINHFNNNFNEESIYSFLNGLIKLI